MPVGRPRLTPEELQARIAEYCDRYGVVARADGLPPFPAGRRETPQHRDWIAVYKAHNRLQRRRRGQCERCSAPVSDGSVFCEEHRAVGATAARASLEQRRGLLEAQSGRCPICGGTIGLRDSTDDGRSALHPDCGRLLGLVEARGPDVLDRLRAYLWPGGSARPTRRR
jgi:hypothetical protein